jgi:Ca2+-transporting ATPase
LHDSCRRIDSKLNVFSNILANRFFVFIFVLCVFLQCVIVNFGGAAFQVTRVDGTAWAISIVIGLLSLPVGMAVRLIPDELFGFVFYGRPESRERYLGGQVPSMVYATENDCVVYQGSSDTMDQEQSVVTIGIDDHGKNYK